jgi:integrase
MSRLPAPEPVPGSPAGVGLPRVHPHTLRHTFAARLILEGLTPRSFKR